MLRSTLMAAAAAAGLAAFAPETPPYPIQLVALPAPFVAAVLSLPPADAAGGVRGVVIVVPDIVGPDGRAIPYVEALLRHGIAALEIATDPDDPASDDIDATLIAARDMLARDRRFAALPVGVAGFGEGARTALAWAGSMPVAAIYPHCASVALPRPPAEAPMLLLHPAHDATDHDGACARLLQGFGPGGVSHAYDDATPGWDIPPVGALVGPVMQPRTAGAYDGATEVRRYAASFRPAVTDDAARRVAWFFDAAIDRHGPWAPPDMEY